LSIKGPFLDAIHSTILAAAPLSVAWSSGTDDTKIVLTGDSILNRRLSVYDDPGYRELFADIRNADAAFTNFETLIHNYEIPGNAVSGGAYQTSPPWITEELKRAGFNLLSVANDHSFDSGSRDYEARWMRVSSNPSDSVASAKA
jgi:poly-gamma-glutamate capsule biosynthesis protein CapA/YwtB (metallophosphatase superfamily)